MKKIVLAITCIAGLTFGGERVVGGVDSIVSDDFSDDNPTTTDSIGDGWPMDINILTDDSLYTSLIDTIFSDTAPPAIPTSEVYPIVRTRGDNKFSVAYFDKSSHMGPGDVYEESTMRNLVLSDFTISDVDVILDSSKVIASGEEPPGTFDFHINPTGDKWIAYWNSDGTHPRRSWEYRMTKSSDRGEVIDTMGVSTTSLSGSSNFCVTYADNNYNATFVVFAENILSNVSLVIIKNELNSAGDPATATQPSNVKKVTAAGAHYVNSIACTIDKTSGDLVVAYTIIPAIGINNYNDPELELKIRTFNASDLTEKISQQDVATGVQGAPRTLNHGPKAKAFDIVDMGNNVIGIAYSSYIDAGNRQVNFKRFNTSGASGSVYPGTETIILDAIYPSISIDPTESFLVISAFKNIGGFPFGDFGWNNIYANYIQYSVEPFGGVYNINPDRTVDFVNEIFEGSLSSDKASFKNTPTDWYPLFFWTNVSCAIDEHKNAIFVYNDEFNAKILVYKDVPIYKAEAVVESDILQLSGAFDSLVVEPFVATEDSVQYSVVDYGCTPFCDTNVTLLFEQSDNNAFTTKDTVRFNSTNGVVIPNQIFGGEYYKYTITMNSYWDNKRTPLVDSLRITWNIKPRVPNIDSVKIGENGPWISVANAMGDSVVNRLDTVYLAVSGYDHDAEAGFDFFVRKNQVTIDSVMDLSSVNGVYTSIITLAPKDIVDSLYTITLVARDQQDWESSGGLNSAIDTLQLNYVNLEPTAQIRVTIPLINGLDSLDTLISSGDSFFINVGDTAWVNMVTADSNDALLTVGWEDSDRLFSDTTATGPADSVYDFAVLHDHLDTDPKDIPPPGVIDLVPDTIRIIVKDADDEVSIWFQLIPNHYPTLDSVIAVLPWNKYGVKVDSIVDINDNPGTLFWNDITNPDREDNELDILPFITFDIEAVVYDVDVVNNDSNYIDWRFLKTDVNNVCCITDSIYRLSQDAAMDTVYRDTIYRGEALTNVFELNPPDVEITTCDNGGACVSDTLKIKYPRLDTLLADSGYFSTAKAELESIELVLGKDNTKDTVHMAIFSKGTRDLEIYSVRSLSRVDYASWLNYMLRWGDETQPVLLRTDSNHLTNPIRLSQGDSLRMDFYIDVSGETGDRTLHDTIAIYSNDFFQPLLKIPFTIEFNDLPQVSVMRVSPDVADSTLQIDLMDSSSQEIPPFSQFLITFSEPIETANIDSYIQVYSKRDSAVYCQSAVGAATVACQNGEIPTKARIGSLRSRQDLIYYFDYNTPKNYKQQPIQGMADTLMFVPFYTSCNEADTLKPAPRNFIQGDSIGIWISNSVRDSVGTRLDLERDFEKDTVEQSVIYSTSILSSTFNVVSTSPETVNESSVSLNTISPDSDIRINFNNQIARQYVVAEGDTMYPIDTTHMTAPDTSDVVGNGTVSITTTFNGGKEVDLKYVRLANNNSTLVVRPKSKFYAKDTVTVTVADSIIDVWGRSLDGDNSGEGTYILRRQSEACGTTTAGNDSYTFRFVVGASSFYMYPNPFKFEDPLHAEKGCIEFKNLNAISSLIGFDESIHIRIYNVMGQLVYSSAKAKNSPAYSADENSGTPPAFCWNMTNNSGRKVVTGVYMYTIATDDDGVVKKGKLAIIR